MVTIVPDILLGVAAIAYIFFLNLTIKIKKAIQRVKSFLTRSAIIPALVSGTGKEYNVFL